MRYLNTTTLKQTTVYLDNTTVIDTDPRVSNWFSKCPDGYKGEWIGDTYSFVEISSLNTDGTVNPQGYGLELLTRDENEELYTYYDVVTLEPDLVKIQAELDAQAEAEWKASRAELVGAIKVTTLAGNEFDGDETSQTRMSRAITIMTDTDTTMWILANDEAIMVGKAEMMEALKLAGEAQTALWVK